MSKKNQELYLCHNQSYLKQFYLLSRPFSTVDPLKDLTVSMHHRRLVAMACPQFADEGGGHQIRTTATNVLNTAVKTCFSDFTIWLTNLYVKAKQPGIKCYARFRNFSILRRR
jgi:hypothetical protein